MRIRDLHNKLGLLGTVQFTLLQMQALSASNKHSLTRPAYIEALLKHAFFENNFGESFDEIMSPNYALEDAKANIRFTEYGRTNPEAALLRERAQMQSSDIISLMGQAEKWIESKDKSYTHQGNLIAFGKNFEEYFEKGESYGSGWDRIIIALQTFIDEQLLPEYPHSPQLKKYCADLLEGLYPDSPPSKGAEEKAKEKQIKKKMDDLQWYFDNYCVGITQIEDVAEEPMTLSIPQLPSPLESLKAEKFPNWEGTQTLEYKRDERKLIVDGVPHIIPENPAPHREVLLELAVTRYNNDDSGVVVGRWIEVLNKEHESSSDDENRAFREAYEYLGKELEKILKKSNVLKWKNKSVRIERKKVEAL